jgi:hypothetical protein
MYRLSINDKRKYSSTPIVKVSIDKNGKETEEIVMISTLTKKGGDELSKLIVNLLNEYEKDTELYNELMQQQ